MDDDAMTSFCAPAASGKKVVIVVKMRMFFLMRIC